MRLESLRKIDADRLTLVGFYVDDTVRGVENAGLRMDEAEALRLVAAYERSNGRDPGIGEGYARAVSRLLDNAYDADDGPYESATHMAADLALQRHAADVLKAAEAFGKDGTEPQGFDPFLVEYVIKADLQTDPEVVTDWKAIAEGRFDEASRLVEDVIDRGVRDREHLPEGASTWMYDNEIREELPEFDRRSNLVDVLDLPEGPGQYEPTGRDFQEWMAGEPDAHTWDEERHAAEAARFFGRESEPEPEFRTHAQIVQERMDGMRTVSLMPQNVVDEIERLGREGVSFDDKAIYAGGERLGVMVEANDYRAPMLASALAHAVMSERGASASESSAWMFEERPSLGVSEMMGMIDREDGDQRHGLSKGTSERIAMSQAKDAVRGLTSSDRSVDGMVTACELAAEERGVPLDRLIAAVAEERRRSDRSFAADSDRVNDAVKDVLRESQVEKALEDRGVKPDAPEKPFFAMPTIANMDQASNDVRDVSDAIRHSDPTIMVEKGLRMGVATLDAAGMDVERGTGIDRLEAAWGRVLEMRDSGKGPSLTPEQEARMVVYDVSTQAEAAGIASGFETGRDEALIGRNLVTTLGVRTLTQEQAGPMALNRRELADVAAGNLAALPRGTQAGFSLGASWAKDSEGLVIRDVQVERPRGLMGQAAGAASKGFSRVGAKAPEAQDAGMSGFGLGGGRGR